MSPRISFSASRGRLAKTVGGYSQIFASPFFPRRRILNHFWLVGCGGTGELIFGRYFAVVVEPQVRFSLVFKPNCL